MSKTISFVASDELADYLEQEAERRMTTISSTAQLLLAEYYKEHATSASSSVSPSTSTDNEDLLEKYSDAWYRPEGKHEYAVRVPDGSDASGPRYYKTADGARERLRTWYE